VRNVVWIATAALVLTLLATLYPALRAARVPPAEALRYG
jgi:lipoprotein-releasing system permease protein